MDNFFRIGERSAGIQRQPSLQSAPLNHLKLTLHVRCGLRVEREHCGSLIYKRFDIALWFQHHEVHIEG